MSLTPLRRRASTTLRLAALAVSVTAGLTLAPGSATAAPAAAAPTASRPSEPAVIAHRGSSGAAPENTIAAIELALAQKSDVVENDIQRTLDGELVIMHDTTLTRTTDVEEVFPGRAPWNVGDFTLAEIKQLDAGSWFAPRYAGERVPTLAEWVDAVGRRAGMLLEPKAPALYPGIEVDLDEELRSMPVFRHALRRDLVTVQSFDHQWLRAYQDLAPDVPTGLLFGVRPTQAEIDAAAVWAEEVNPAFAVSDQATVEAIQAQGMEAHVWTVNGGQQMRQAIDWDVDGIITNYPQVLLDILDRG